MRAINETIRKNTLSTADHAYRIPHKEIRDAKSNREAQIQPKIQRGELIQVSLHTYTQLLNENKIHATKAYKTRT